MISTVLYTITYNSYFDRKFRLEPDVDSYLSIGFNDGHETQAVSFNPSDGINTTQIVNYDASNDDYALLTKKTITYVDDIICDADWSDEQIWVEFISALISCTTTIAGNILQTTGIEEGMYFEEMRSRLVSSATTLGYDGEADAIELTTMADWKAVKVNKPFSNTTREVVEHEIVSRWFILDAVRQRTGQYLLHLKRDTLADYSDNILSANFFCERGYLDDGDSMICNNEGMTFNQLKEKEQLIKGKWNTPWLVGYISSGTLKNSEGTITEVTFEDKRTNSGALTMSELSANTGISVADLTTILTSEETLCLQDKSTLTFRVTSKKEGAVASTTYGRECLTNNDNKIIYTGTPSATFVDFTNYQNILTFTYTTNNPYLLLSQAFVNYDLTEITKLAEGNQIVLNLQQNGALKYYLDNYPIQFTDGTTYNFSYVINTASSVRKRYGLSTTETAVANFINTLKSISGVSNVTIDTANELSIHMTVAPVTITKEAVITNNTYKIPLSVNKKHCLNSTCDIFAIPMNSINFYFKTTSGKSAYEKTINDKYLTKAFAIELAKQLGDQCYDIQLLPYCPLDNFKATRIINTDNTVTYYLNITNLTQGVDFDIIERGDSGDTAGLIYWFENKDMTFIKSLNLTYSNRKQESNTDFIRFVSPNGTGSFEMNLAKNLGLKQVYINCTFKPFQPFIQVLPEFSGNYGLNFEDYRGLICQGDYSIDRVNDKFIDYSLANKNYQAIFNKELSAIDYNNRLADLQSGVGAVTGTIGGALGGAMGGMKVGGAGGAVVGAIAGLGAGAIGGAMNYTLGKEARAVERNLTVDRYNWNLGNIKSQPASLSKIDNFNVISKIYPYIEFYTCTDEEKATFEKAMKYNGYAVGRIGTVKEFINPDDWQWIKGEVIQLGLDNHTAQDIYSELKKGVFARNYEFSK